MSEAQRQALALLARPGWTLRGTAVFDLADERHPRARIHPGVVAALMRRRFLAPMTPGRSAGEYYITTSAGREALAKEGRTE